MAEVIRNISISIDVKKHRIRIHKPTIHLMGDPKLIQLLFNPVDMEVAIRCTDEEVPGGQEIRVNPKKLQNGYDVEFYSSMLIDRMRSFHGDMKWNGTYRLSGSYFPSMRVALFPMNTLQRFEYDEGATHV